MAPFVIGRDPWNREAMRRDAFTHGLWQFRAGTGNFAWAGIDMALWDICGRACGQPLWRLLGGLQQQEATYFYYLARGSRESLAAQVADGPRRRLRGLLPQGRARRRGGSRDGRGRARGARRRPAAPPRRERQLVAPAGRSQPAGARGARHRLRRAARARSSDRPPRRAAPPHDDRGLRERGALVGGRRVRAHPCAAGGRLLLLAVLGRLARRLPSACVGRGVRRASGLQAHARGARHRRRGGASRRADAARTASRATSRPPI